jgi:flagellar biosynthesis/type III secretory pathway protein FliH
MNRMEKWAAYFSPSTSDEELAEIAASETAIQEAMEVEDVFTKDEVAKRSYEKAEKFRRDQAAQLRYAEEEGRKEGQKEGEKKGIIAMIITLKELNVDKATIIDKIMTRFNLNLNVAQGYVEANW